jgi:hypothetical protein
MFYSFEIKDNSHKICQLSSYSSSYVKFGYSELCGGYKDNDEKIIVTVDDCEKQRKFLAYLKRNNYHYVIKQDIDRELLYEKLKLN